MRLPLNSLAMFVATTACFVLAWFVWTAGSTYFSFPSLVQDAVAYVCVGLGFVFLAMFIAALYDDISAQQGGDE